MPPSDPDALDALAGASWRVAGAEAGSILDPSSPAFATLDWIDAMVPGTVAMALVAAGRDPLHESIDDRDWWFATQVEVADGGAAELVLEGLAAPAEVWLDGVAVASVVNMFTSRRVRVETSSGRLALVMRFRSVAAEPVPRRPRARWRVPRMRHAGGRWLRQSLWGRLIGVPPSPPPVGPWRPVRLLRDDRMRILSRRIIAEPRGAGGEVSVRVDLRGGRGSKATADFEVNGTVAPARIEVAADGSWSAIGSVSLDSVERWWPGAMGPTTRYPLALRVDGARFELGRVGFRDLRVDRGDGFRFVVNGIPVFVGGAVWMPADPIGLQHDPATLRPLLHRVVDAGLFMLRVPGDTVYESDEFYEACDELGILVWQDCMLAFTDPPADERWEAELVAEVRENLTRLSGHPSLALVSGGTEIAQQAAYSGVMLTEGIPLITDTLPVAVAEGAGPVEYLPNSPWGGDIVTRPDAGVAHYYGVGAYLRRLDDARRARPRFAAECLAFAVPPQRQTVDRAFGGPAAADHDPEWKRAVYRDAGASWDFEDVRDYYVGALFEVDPLDVRRSDPDRSLELGRAAVAHAVESTLAEWRRAESPSGGGLVFHLADALPGAGMGMIDSDGVPKSSWYAARRALAAVAVSISDEGLNGLVAHVHNSRAVPWSGELRVHLFVGGELRVDSAVLAVALESLSSREIGIDGLFAGFRDLAWAHRFGPLTYDVILAELRDASGATVAETVRLPGGLARPIEHDLGLEVELLTLDDGRARLKLRTRRFAQFVSIDFAGWIPDDCGFDLAPGRSRTVVLSSRGEPAPLIGTVRALNGRALAVRAPGASSVHGRTRTEDPEIAGGAISSHADERTP